MARVWLNAGPTASGKSTLALRWAETTGAEIINADSMQLYVDLRVLAARPSWKMKRAHPTYGVENAVETWSAGARKRFETKRWPNLPL